MTTTLSANPRPAASQPAPEAPPRLSLALPKGRIQEGVFRLLADAGIDVRVGPRGYRPSVSLPGVDAKILKPQNALEMLASGSRDAGFGGADWVQELDLDVVEVLDTGLDPVRLVAAAPPEMVDSTGRLKQPKDRPLRVASEYEAITRRWIEKAAPGAAFVRSYGATEAFPPEDADCIVDVAATGETLRAQGLVVIETVLTSTTRLYASRAAIADPERRAAIDRLALLLASVLEARRRVMLEVNVTPEALDRVVAVMPCMRQPTISPLRDGAGFAVKSAAPRASLPTLIPEIKARGGTDIVVTEMAQLVP
ncbi:MAG: ATP phosphoribosyltransferase [Planctomycetes bacterium]|nr:ATP phosphoribosyltransferase [Planctomycetota bacterium]